MRKVKCRVCSTLNDIDVAYKHVHITNKGKEVNMYYCSESEFLKQKSEKEYRAKFEEKFNDIMNYTVINSNAKRLYNEIQKSGYSNKEIYECLLEKESEIIGALRYRRNIKDENNKIKYAFAIIRNAMFDVTLKKRKEEKIAKMQSKSKEQSIEVSEYKRDKQSKHERRGLLDIIGGSKWA